MLEAATALVQENDQIRTAFIELFYRVPWESPCAFDMAINSSVIRIELATNWITSCHLTPPSRKQAPDRLSSPHSDGCRNQKIELHDGTRLRRSIGGAPYCPLPSVSMLGGFVDGRLEFVQHGFAFLAEALDDLGFDGWLS